MNSIVSAVSYCNKMFKTTRTAYCEPQQQIMYKIPRPVIKSYNIEIVSIEHSFINEHHTTTIKYSITSGEALRVFYEHTFTLEDMDEIKIILKELKNNSQR